MGAAGFINRCTEDYIVLSDCDVICNIDLSDVIRQHAETGAEITVVTKRLDPATTFVSGKLPVVTTNAEGVVTDFSEEEPTAGEVDVSTNIMVMSRPYLVRDDRRGGSTRIQRLPPRHYPQIYV